MGIRRILGVASSLPAIGIGLGAVAVFVLAGWAIRSHHGSGQPGPPPEPKHSAPADPRLTYATPFLNVRPEVKYVGDAACADCHPDLTASYHRHAMGRSLALASTVPSDEHLDAAAHDPFEIGGFRYRIERRGGQLFHRETALDPQARSAADLEVEVRYAVGSGRNGRSFLIERDGYLFESPITWYPRKGTWGLSPGYSAKANNHFNRPVVTECLFCHSNRVEPVPGTTNRYEQPIFHGLAIGCERCHGPGELHVRQRQEGGTVAGADVTIVNPKWLSPSLRAAICEQCHLEVEQRVARRGRQPFEFRPGLPLKLFVSDFARPGTNGGQGKFIGAVEQMMASGCYRAAPDRLGCTSCHDPHVPQSPKAKLADFRARCLACHADHGCSLPIAQRRARTPEDACTICHMPRGNADIPHTAVTDHRIPRRPSAAEAPSSSWKGPPILEYFHPGPDDPPPAEIQRDRGVALLELAERLPTRAAHSCAEQALPLLEAALATDPDDLPADEAHAKALWYLGRTTEADDALQSLLDRAPKRETTLFLATTLALHNGRPMEARTLARRLVAVNPWRPRYHLVLAAACARSQDWPGARDASLQALRLDPTNLPSRQVLISAYQHLGETDQARAELAHLQALRRQLQSAP